MKFVFLLLMLLPLNSFAQDLNPARIQQQSEIGLHVGLSTIYGDIAPQPNWSAGFHIRRAIDHLFSIRVDGRFGQAKGNDSTKGAYLTDFQGISGQLLISLNGMRWDNPNQKKWNPYFLVGAGMSRFRVDALPRSISLVEERDWTRLLHLETGVGIAYRINERLNLGIEANVAIPNGENADRFDGVEREVRDVINYTNIRLNFNIGKRGLASEPLYWVNPFKTLQVQITELKEQQTIDPKDTDQDGVFDMIDEEPNTPLGAMVDVKGRTLDSDGDGYPDYLDQEPFSIPGYSVDENGVNNDSTLNYATKSDLKILQENILRTQTEAKYDFDRDSEMINWLLPMVHFHIDSDEIRNADFSNLVNVAKIMKSKPHIKLVVTGFTDQTSSNTYNKVLSYNRAKSVIEFLVVAQNIDRKRLILQYSGESSTIVPTAGDSFVNRRVEFRVARTDEKDMLHPKK